VEAEEEESEEKEAYRAHEISTSVPLRVFRNKHECPPSRVHEISTSVPLRVSRVSPFACLGLGGVVEVAVVTQRAIEGIGYQRDTDSAEIKLVKNKGLEHGKAFLGSAGGRTTLARPLYRRRRTISALACGRGKLRVSPMGEIFSKVAADQLPSALTFAPARVT
jgi:hypothetical protein